MPSGAIPLKWITLTRAFSELTDSFWDSHGIEFLIQLNDLLKEIKEGKIQLPDFQRGWVWDDDHIRDLLVSIARSFPIGAVMLLEAGGDVRFETRPVEGLEDKLPQGQEPEKLILDGQQRLTTLTQALSLDEPVHTRTAKGKKINRHYYFDISKAVVSQGWWKIGELA